MIYTFLCRISRYFLFLRNTKSDVSWKNYAATPCEIMSDPRVHRMRGILRFSPTFTLTLSHGGGGIAVGTRQERVDGRYTASKKLFSFRRTTFLSFYFDQTSFHRYTGDNKCRIYNVVTWNSHIASTQVLSKHLLLSYIIRKKRKVQQGLCKPS